MPSEATPDADLLAVLKRAGHDDLAAIAAFLDRSWDVRVTRDSRYVANRDDLTRVPELLEEHLRRAGGNALRNLVRGGGPPYPEILADVCKVMHVEIAGIDGVVAREEALLTQMAERVWSKLTDAEREAIVRDAAAQMEKLGAAAGAVPLGLSWALPLSALAGQVGARLASFIVYQTALQIANALARQLLGHGLTLAANALLVRALSVVIGPVGWAVTALWTAVDVAGPSYKGLVPAVFHVAVLRQQQVWQTEGRSA